MTKEEIEKALQPLPIANYLMERIVQAVWELIKNKGE